MSRYREGEEEDNRNTKREQLVKLEDNQEKVLGASDDSFKEEGGIDCVNSSQKSEEDKDKGMTTGAFG